MTDEGRQEPWGGLAADVLDAMVDPLVVLRPVRDASGAVVDAETVGANAAARAQLGGPDDLLGHRLFAVAALDPAMLDHIAAVQGSDRPVAVDNYVVRNPTEPTHLLVDVRGWRAGDCVVLTWRDVTEYADLLDAAREAEQRSRLVAENAADLVYLRDADGIIRWISPSVQQLLGHPVDSMVGHDISEIVHPDDLHLVGEARAAVAADQEPPAVLARIRRADGEYRWMSVVSRPVVEDGRPTGATVGFRDVHGQVLAQQAAEDSERRYRLVAEHSSDVILLSNQSTELLWVSPSSRETLGWEPADLVGLHARDFIHPDDLADLLQQVQDSTSSGGAIRIRYRWRRPDGAYRWVEAIGRPIDDDGQGRPGRVVQLRDIEAQHRAELELERRAHWDELTSLLSRGEVLNRLGSLLADRRSGGRRAALAFCDLDGLKDVNDAHGHAAGDALLEACAARVRDCVRESDLVGRMGGDEILVVLDGVTNIAEAEDRASAIRCAVAEPIDVEGRQLATTVSIGVVLAVPGDDVDTVVRRADAAMYAAKRRGRDRVVAWSVDLEG